MFASKYLSVMVCLLVLTSPTSYLALLRSSLLYCHPSIVIWKWKRGWKICLPKTKGNRANNEKVNEEIERNTNTIQSQFMCQWSLDVNGRCSSTSNARAPARNGSPCIRIKSPYRDPVSPYRRLTWGSFLASYKLHIGILLGPCTRLISLADLLGFLTRSWAVWGWLVLTTPRGGGRTGPEPQARPLAELWPPRIIFI